VGTISTTSIESSTERKRGVHGDIDHILIRRDEIAARVETLAQEIRRDWAGHGPDEEILLIPVLTGALIFVADLIRHLPHKIRLNVITARSYHGASTTSSGDPIVNGLPDDLRNQHVLIVDDILDSGTTIRRIQAMVEKRGPKSAHTCVLLRKKLPSAMATPCSYVGFDIENEFIVGYGLDYNGYYRNLPDIGVPKRELLGADES